MLRSRLIWGFSLAGLTIGLMLMDGYLSMQPPPEWTIPGTSLNPGRWLYTGFLSAALVTVFVWLGTNELLQFAIQRGRRPHPYLTQLGAVALITGPYIESIILARGESIEGPWVLFLLCLLLGMAFLVQAVLRGTEDVMANVSLTLFIILYCGGFGSFLLRLRTDIGGSTGIALFLFTILVIKLTDVGAFFTGRWLGRHKMIPWLSPKKTWEGFFGGIVVAALAAVGCGSWLAAAGYLPIDSAVPPVWIFALFGLLMGGLSVLGDLCASLLKRDAAVKDSGATLRGLGGVLDVLDSLLIPAPVAWIFWTHLFVVTPGA